MSYSQFYSPFIQEEVIPTPYSLLPTINDFLHHSSDNCYILAATITLCLFNALI